MRTLADVKRRMTEGTQYEVIEQTKRPVLVGTVRTVVRTGASRVEFTSSHTDDEVYNQAWPKARDIRIMDAHTYEVALRGPGMDGHVARFRFRDTGHAEPWCNHDPAAVRNGVCECGQRISWPHGRTAARAGTAGT